MKFLGLAAGPAWLLLAGSAIAVVLLYLLRPTPRRLLVASGLIWQRVLRARQREPERLRWWLSLLLALAIALSVALALTQPEISALGGSAEDHVLVIDNSPSMAARSADGRTRLQHALEQAAGIVRTSGAGSRFLVVDTMHQLPVVGFVSRAAALEQMRGIEPRAGTTPWFPDAARVSAPSGTTPGIPANPRRTWLVTDGVTPLPTPTGTQMVSVFQSASNVGITAFDVRALPSDPRHHEAFIEVSNAAPSPAQVEVQLAGAGGTTVERTLRVPGNAAAHLVLDASGFGEGALRASVRADDDALDLDDTAYAYLPGKSRVRLALVTPGNADLARALRLLPRLDLAVLSPARMRDIARFDAAILDGVTPAQAPPVPSLLIAPARASWLAGRTIELNDTRIARWDGTHPLLAGITLRDVLIDRAAARRTGAAPNAVPGTLALTPIAHSPNNEALLLATREGQRIAVLGFALEASNFALHPGFPGFLTNAVDWLTREPHASAQQLGLVSLPLPSANVLDLEGKAIPTRAIPGATLFDATRPGLYTAVTQDQRLRVAVNLLDARVTAINGTSGAPGASLATAPPPATWAPDPWLALLLAAITLLALEWWTFHRRLTV